MSSWKEESMQIIRNVLKDYELRQGGEYEPIG